MNLIFSSKFRNFALTEATFTLKRDAIQPRGADNIHPTSRGDAIQGRFVPLDDNIHLASRGDAIQGRFVPLGDNIHLASRGDDMQGRFTALDDIQPHRGS